MPEAVTKHDHLRSHIEGEDAKALMHEIQGLREQLRGEHSDNLDSNRAVVERLTRIEKAFPGEDPEGHRRFHEALIAESLARRAFWSDLRGKLIERGIWAAIIFVAGAVWWYAKEKL